MFLKYFNLAVDAIRQNALLVVITNAIAITTTTTTNIGIKVGTELNVALIVLALVLLSKPQKACVSYITTRLPIRAKRIARATVIAIQGPGSTFLCLVFF